MVQTESKSAWAVTPTKSQNLKPQACLHDYKISNESDERLTYKVYVNMGNNSVKYSSIKNPISHAHLHIIGRKCT